MGRSRKLGSHLGSFLQGCLTILGTQQRDPDLENYPYALGGPCPASPGGSGAVPQCPETAQKDMRKPMQSDAPEPGQPLS